MLCHILTKYILTAAQTFSANTSSTYIHTSEEAYVSLCMYLCMYVCMYVCMYIHAYTHTHTHTHTRIHIYIPEEAPTPIWWKDIYMYTCMYACVYICGVHAYVCMKSECIHVHTHTHAECIRIRASGGMIIHQKTIFGANGYKSIRPYLTVYSAWIPGYSESFFLLRVMVFLQVWDREGLFVCFMESAVCVCVFVILKYVCVCPCPCVCAVTWLHHFASREDT